MHVVGGLPNRWGSEHNSMGLPSNRFRRRFCTHTTKGISASSRLLSPRTSAICNTISASWPTPKQVSHRCWYSGFVAHRDHRYLAVGADYTEFRRHSADADTEDRCQVAWSWSSRQSLPD